MSEIVPSCCKSANLLSYPPNPPVLALGTQTVLMVRFWSGWKDVLIIVKSNTVVGCVGNLADTVDDLRITAERVGRNSDLEAVKVLASAPAVVFGLILRES